MKTLLRILFFLPVCVAAQHADNWYFGDHAAITFSSGSPVALTNSAMYALEGCVSYSDAQGNLLFYSNGGPHSYQAGVWNRNHVLMPNGDFSNTSGCYSAIQSCLVIPDPGNADRYYLFTLDCIEHQLAGGLRVNIIDMTMDNGLGDIVVKDSLIDDSTMECMGAVVDKTNTGYWLITHKKGQLRFVSLHITASGISAPVYSSEIPMNMPDNAGTIRLSCDGSKLAWATLSGMYLYDFNNATGVVSNALNLNVSGFTCCFSPGGHYLYVADAYPTDPLYQFDMLAANIPASVVTINPGNNVMAGSMQLAPDGKIYITDGSSYLSTINSPGNPGASCNYAYHSFFLGANFYGLYSLPNYIENELTDCSGEAQSVTESHAVPFSLFPNPADDELQIQVSAVATLTLYDARGRVVLEQQLTNGNNHVALEGLEAGFYSVKVTTEEGKSSVQKLLLR